MCNIFIPWRNKILILEEEQINKADKQLKGNIGYIITNFVPFKLSELKKKEKKKKEE
jgi:hypothetical protein